MILLTGSTGFVGGEVLSQLVERVGLPVCSFGRRQPDRLDLSGTNNVSHVFGTIGDESNIVHVLCGVDVLIHCAGLAHVAKGDDLSFHNVNTSGTIKLAKQAVKAGVKRFVFVSSIGVNGTSTDTEPFSVNSAPNPHNSYAQSKYEAELGLKKLAAETGLEVVIVRPTLVYGPNAPGNFGLLTKVVKKLPALPFGLANNKRDFIAVQNLADLLVTCATHPDAAGHTFLASDGETVSIKEFTNAIADGLGKKVIQLPIPVSIMRLLGKVTGKSAMIEQLYGNLQVDSSNIKDVLGWTPPYTMQQVMATLGASHNSDKLANPKNSANSDKSSSGKELI